MNRRIFVLLSAALCVSASVAHAQWPMNRHDSHRTARASNTSQLARPVRVWSHYLGGSLRSDAYLATDLTRGCGARGDGGVSPSTGSQIVYVSGGRVTVKTPDDRTVWETATSGLQHIAGIEDLNGDGELDVVAVGYPALVAIYGGCDGRLQWRTASDTFGPSLGAVRLADFNGDGRRDLYVAEANCGSIGQRGDIAWAYTFGGGFGAGVEDSSTRLWQLERGRDYVCGVNDVLADMTNDGRPDVLAFSSNHVWLFNGRDGRKVPSGMSGAPAYDGYALGFSVPYGGLASDAVDVDGDVRPEVIGYTNNNYEPSINSRSVFVLNYDPARSQATRLAVRWRQSVPSLTTDEHRYIDAGAVDLDRDGRVEVVSTFDIAGTGPVTTIYRGSDGEVLQRLTGVTVVGVLDTGVGLPVTLLVRRGVNLEGYRFSSFGTDATAPAPAFMIPDVETLNFNNITRRQRGSAVSEVVSIREEDGMHRALVVRVNNTQRLQVYAVRGAAPVRLAEFDFGTVGVSGLRPALDVSGEAEALLATRTDGVLVVLDRNLRALNLGSPEIPMLGVRFGGYYTGGRASLTGPVAGRLGTMGDSVLVRDSQQNLLRLDAVGASRVRPPTVAWRWPGAIYPSILDVDGDGVRDVMATADTRQRGNLRTLEVRRADGTTVIWSRTVPDRSSEVIFGDVVPLTGETGGTYFALSTIDPSNGRGRVYGYSTRGDRVFSTEPRVTIGSGQGQITAFDINNDRREDPLLNLASVLVGYSGANGSLLTSGLGTHPLMPIHLEGGAAPVSMIMGGAHGAIDGVSFSEQTGTMAPYRVNSQWVTSTMTYPPGSFTYCYGATVRCPDGLRFAQTMSTTPRIVVMEASTGRVLFDVALANGRTFATESELRAMVSAPGLLGHVTASSAIDGTRPAFVTGSTDGHLYALDACAAAPSLLWQMDFRAPVGEAIFADTDGDGFDEIVVSSADGFIHGVDTEEIAAPSVVLDVDPPRVTDVDVDEVHGITVSAAWPAVTGAVEYEWALFTERGTPVSRRDDASVDPFIRTRERTATWGLGLTSGARYYFAVRAINAVGRSSVETLSDGVRFVREAPMADAAVVADVTVTPDVADGAAPTMDVAAVDATTLDAAISDASADAAPPPGEGAGGGCGCATPRTAPQRAWTALAVAGIALARRRRRGQNHPSYR